MNETSHIWKGLDGGSPSSKPLSDCTDGELRRHLAFCDEMLSNADPKRPGRLVLKRRAEETRLRCLAEMTARWLESERGYSRSRCLEDLRAFVAHNTELLAAKPQETLTLADVMDGLPEGFSEVRLDDLIRADCGSLGRIDPKPFTLKFALWCGVSLSRAEVSRIPMGVSPIDHVNDTLNIPDGYRLRRKENGVTLAQMDTILHMTAKRYEEMSDKELEDIAGTLVPRLVQRYDMQCARWEGLKREIEEEISKRISNAK